MIARNYLILVSLTSGLRDISSWTQNTLEPGLGARRRKGIPPRDQECGLCPEVSEKQTPPTQQTPHDEEEQSLLELQHLLPHHNFQLSGSDYPKHSLLQLRDNNLAEQIPNADKNTILS